MPACQRKAMCFSGAIFVDGKPSIAPDKVHFEHLLIILVTDDSIGLKRDTTHTIEQKKTSYDALNCNSTSRATLSMPGNNN
jgi:hypothetical protein